MKRAEVINRNYLVDHAEDIINNTDVIFPYWLWSGSHSETTDGEFLLNIFKRIEQKQLYESGNWNIFGRGDPWIGPGETWEEAEDRIVREYCEATGHWDLFIWNEVKE
ncbi:MAG: hypothetical protein IJL02_05395 [Methanobrevibacter sp.]|uniref:hypothetical protein n=1 Tax=Methanobrevibacter sp. TaxID=66852 RepID=UPI0025FE12EA|nr:hypothetical protein [Methanobrevibacter sp.]MBQ6099281.1 hypothetical protein [Methanobrevibacter sp.]